ncbi:MAG: hypothetical protein EP335_00285 [Alphaproteobacteria bacterium]|nr:MAG: hypothetical protein EP335_00285 [Alphaproteobacteria bacterium]
MASRHLALGELNTALWLCEAACRTTPAAAILTTKAAVLRALHRDVDAASALDQARTLAPNDVGLRILRAHLAATLGEHATAEALLATNLATNPTHPATILARIETAFDSHMPATQRQQLVDESYRLFETALLDGTAKAEDIRQAMGDLAFRTRQWRQALGHWSAIGLDDDTVNRRSLQRAQCHLFLIDDVSARRCLEAFLAKNPTSVSAINLMAELELSLGHWARSLALREHLFTMNGLHRVPIGVRLAQDYLLRDDRARAEALQAECEQLAGERLEISYARLLMMQDRAADAWDYVSPWRDCVEQSPLVARLFQGLGLSLGLARKKWQSARFADDTPGNTPSGIKTPDEVRAIFSAQPITAGDAISVRANLRFAWQVRQPDAMPYDDWLETTLQTAAAVCLLVPEPKVSARDIAQLTVSSDFDILRPFMDRDEPVLFACSHQGPFLQHVLALFFPRLRFITTNKTFDDSGNPDSRNLSLQGDRVSTVVGLVKALQNGQTLILPIDNGSLSFVAGKSASATTGLLFGIPTRIPDTIPRLSCEFGRPSFWVYSHWQDGQVRYDIQRLPDTMAGEGRNAWHRRWADAYLARLEAVMRSDAQNVNLAAPLWRHLLLNQDKNVN